MSMSLFGTSGIRGKIRSKITSELALKVGKAIATYVGGGKIVIGHDPRTSSEMLVSAVAAGLMECGSKVIRIGMVPTPALGYAVKKLNADTGVMITASHNPPEYNGIKAWNANGMAYTPSQEDEIERIIHDNDFDEKEWDKIGNIKDAKIIEDYKTDLINSIDIKNELKVVVDAGCGAASYVTPYVLRELGCEVITLNCQPDGFFPGRNPEPTEENLKDLMETVKAVGADIGIAHDGDADRAVIVTDEGKIADFDKLLALVSKKYGGTIVTTVDASLCIEECMEEIGGKVIRTKVGDVNVANEIMKHNASFGGEPSGTWIHPTFSLTPDGIFSALRVVEVIDKEGNLSDLLAEIPSYPNIRDKIQCPDMHKKEVMKIIEPKLKNEFPKAKIDKIDGIRITLKDKSWILVRPSGTEPYIRIRAESRDKNKLKNIYNKVHSIVKKAINTVVSCKQ